MNPESIFLIHIGNFAGETDEFIIAICLNFLRRLNEHMKVDVCLLTLNSVRPCLEESLQSVLENVPVNRLVVIDGYSTDETLDVISKQGKEYGVPVSVVQMRGSRAKARQQAVVEVETEWFMFVDSDVILCRNWFKKAGNHMTPKVGLIWGWDVIANPHARNRMKVMYYLRRLSEYELMKRNFDRRGGTHDTLIRTQVVKDIKIPSELHIYEDWFIKKFVEDKGYQCVVPPDVYCFHHFDPQYSLQELSLIARLQREYGLQSDFITLRNMFLAVPKCAAILMTSRDLKACTDQWKMYAYNFIGRFLL